MMQYRANKQEITALDELRLHLKRAVKTLKLQPYNKGDKPIGMQSSTLFMDTSQQALHRAGINKNQIKATPKQVTHMQYWLDQMLRLDLEARRIIMARAAGVSWRRLEEIDGRSHTTLRKVEKAGLASLLGALVEARAILPRDLIA